MPDVSELVTLDQPSFEREKIEDQGVSVTKFDQESPATVIDSERTWLVTYRPAAGQAKPPSSFRFASAKVADADMIYQRYVDADLAKVGAEVTLQERYERAQNAWLWWSGGGLLALAFAVLAIRILRTGPKRAASTRFQMPERVTPFSVLGLLRDIQQNNGLAAPRCRSSPSRSKASSDTTLPSPAENRSTSSGLPKRGSAGSREGPIPTSSVADAVRSPDELIRAASASRYGIKVDRIAELFPWRRRAIVPGEDVPSQIVGRPRGSGSHPRRRARSKS